MPVKNNREYRSAAQFRAAENEEYIVEGYASTFEPYVLYSDGNRNIYERINEKAFDNADMTDVIMQYDHEGRVYARQSNGTLNIDVDEVGLKIRADLSKSNGAKELYNDIKEGLITKMSFAFTISEEEFERDTDTRHILAIDKVYDVSAVSIPANPDTAISARDYFNGVIEMEAKAEAERLQAEKREEQKRRIRMKEAMFNDRS